MKENTIEKARAIEQRYGSNYYVATLFLPKHIKEAVFVLYAFVRIPDEMVDNPAPGTDPAAELAKWKHDWQNCYDGQPCDNDIMVATREVFLTYDIPVALSQEFIGAMIQDLTTSRYQTYADLQAYIRGSADVVGLMLVRVFGRTEPAATARAAKLGEAMQLTNFLRDVGEDYVERNRIYLPTDDLKRFGVTEAMIKQQQVTTEFQELMKYYIKHARSLFIEANQGIDLLPKKIQRGVRLASTLYEGILDRIEDNQYDVLTQKAKHSFIQKCQIIIKQYV